MKPSRSTAAAFALTLPLIGGSAAYAATLDPAPAAPERLAPGNPVPSEGTPDQRPLDELEVTNFSAAAEAYWRAGFDFEDLETLGAEWNIDSLEAKGPAGQAILNGRMDEIIALVGEPDPAAAAEASAYYDDEANQLPSSEDVTGIDPFRGWSEEDFDAYQAYWVGGFSYDQLLDLAVEWNLSEFEAKARAGQAVLDGDTAEIVALVGEPDPDAGAEAAAMYAEIEAHAEAESDG